jgi:N4-gp56 family major capsid protein
MSTITTTSSLPPPVQQWFDDVLLSRPEPLLIHNKMAMRKRLPMHSGRTIRFRRYTNLQTATVPLGPSGLTPPPQTLSALDIDAIIDWYGTYVIVTDQVTIQNQDAVLNETASLLAQTLRETEDELTRNMLEATASFINCVNGVNGDNPTEFSRADINGVVFTLIGNSARMISDNIEGEDRFGTSPVRESYWAMCHSDVLTDLESVSGFINTAQYPAQMNILHAEWGSVGNTRWLYSPLGSITSNASLLGNNVYNCFVTAREAYTHIEQDGASAQFIYQGLGAGNDPLLQRQTAGWKSAMVPRLLNDSWLINLRTTLS